MDHTERRRRILTVAGLLAGCLMLATAAILVGGAFTGTQLTLAGLPDGRHPGPWQREPRVSGVPGAIESSLARYRVPVTRPVHTTRPPADPAPTHSAKRTAQATPTSTRSTGTPSPQVSPNRGLSPAPSPYRRRRPTPWPALSEAATGSTPPPRSASPSPSPAPHTTKKPWPGKRP